MPIFMDMTSNDSYLVTPNEDSSKTATHVDGDGKLVQQYVVSAADLLLQVDDYLGVLDTPEANLRLLEGDITPRMIAAALKLEIAMSTNYSICE